MPELSSLRLNKKLYNNRLQNEQEHLKKIVSGVTKDINDISTLIFGLERYRSTVSDFRRAAQSKASDKEGFFGRVP